VSYLFVTLTCTHSQRTFDDPDEKAHDIMFTIHMMATQIEAIYDQQDKNIDEM